MGLPTGEALKNKLKGEEVEIEKEIKLPDGSTLSLELEAEEGEIEFSLEIERDDDEDSGGGGVKGGVKGLRNIAGNVLSSLIDVGTGNLADILRNQIGLKIDFEALQDLISGEEGVGEILEDLGRSAIRKLAEYPLQLLKDVFSVDPKQALDLLEKAGLNSGQIDTLTQFFNNEIASSQIGGNILGLLPTDDLIALGTPFGGFVEINESLEQIAIVNSPIERLKPSGDPTSDSDRFYLAWKNVSDLAAQFYGKIKEYGWEAVTTSELNDWEEAVQNLENAFKDIGAYTRGTIQAFGVLERYGEEQDPRNRPTN